MSGGGGVNLIENLGDEHRKKSVTTVSPHIGRHLREKDQMFCV